MKRLLPIAVVLLSCIITCQAQGIAFVSTSWDETVQNAVKNDKQIFLYAQTKSCRYCRQMEKEVFTDPGVIDFYNKHFISYKIDDDDDGPGEALSKQYGVMGFPTYLYFDKSGQKLHQSSRFKPADAFIQDAIDASNPDKALFSLMNKYDRGEKSPELLYNLSNALSYYLVDDSPKEKITEEYLATQSVKELESEKNLRFIFDNHGDIKSSATRYLLENQEKFVPLFGKADVDKTSQRIVTRTAEIAGRANDQALMDDLKKIITGSFADTAKALSVAGIYFYRGREDWPNYAKATLHYGSTVGTTDWQTMYESGAYLKYFAKDQETLKIAVQVMDKVLKLHKNYEHLCIYSRLQSKVGNNVLALKAANEATELAKPEGQDGDEARKLIAELNAAKK